MKAIWKVLIGAAALAAVTPYQVTKDEETGDITLKAATWAGKYAKNGDDRNLTIKLLPGIIKDKSVCGDECCCEDEDTIEAGGTESEEDEDGITIELDIEKDEPEKEPASEDAPKSEEA